MSSDLKTAEEVFQIIASSIDAGESFVFTRTIPTRLEEYMGEVAGKLGIEVLRVSEEEFKREAGDTSLFLKPLVGLVPGSKGVVALGFTDGVLLVVLTWFYLVGYGVGSDYTYLVRITPEERSIIRIDKPLFMAASTRTITW